MKERVWKRVTAAAAVAASGVLVACGGGADEAAKVEASAAAASSSPEESVEALRLRSAAVSAVYVDAVAGNDANAGTQAAPWKTLAKVAATRLSAGQNVLLNCGSVWRESAVFSSSTMPANTTVGAYGTCVNSLPRISGAADLSQGWTRSGNIWSRSVPAGTPKVSRLFIAGVPHRVAQWPNYVGKGSEYAKTDAPSTASRTQFVVAAADRAALTGKLTPGAVAQVRSDPWYIETLTVTSWNSGTGVVTVSGSSTYPMEGGNGYVLQGQQWMLDAPGEFFHDTVNNKLYVYPSQSGPLAALNSYLVEGSVRDIALSVSNVPGLVVKGIAVGQARQVGVLVQDSLGANISAAQVVGNGDTGVRLVLHSPPAAGTSGGTVSGNLVSDNGRFGIDTTYAASVTISSNTVQDTGNLAYEGISTAAIKAGDANIVSGNRVLRTAYQGIYFSGAGGTQVTGNLISEYCLRLTDCAGIYTWNGSTAPLATAGMSSTVANNRLLAVTANTEGAVGGGFDLVGGIYLDNFSTGVTLRNNIVESGPYGIIVHNSSNNVIDQNKVWLSTVASLKLSMDLTGGSDWMSGNVVSANQLVPALTATGTYPTLPVAGLSLAVQFSDVISGSATLSSGSNLFKGNTIVALNDAAAIVATVSGGSGSNGATFMNAQAWKALNPAEGSVKMPVQFALYQLNLGNEAVTGGDFSYGMDGWTSWFQGGAGSGSAVMGSMGGCSGNCVLLTTSTLYDSLMSPAFNLTVGIPHVVSFNATLSANATIGPPYIGAIQAPGGSVVAPPGFSTTTAMSGMSGSTVSYQGFFVPSSAGSARLNLKVATPGVAVGFDNVSIKPVVGYSLSKVSDYVAAVNSEIGTASTINCTDLGWPSTCTVKDVNGASVTMPLALPAGSSMLLLRSNSAWVR